MPDVFVPLDTTYNTDFYSGALGDGLIVQFSYDYLDRNRTRFSKYNSFDEFNKSFSVTDDIYQHFTDYAIKNGKLAAFTETGLESIPNPAWWTETLLKALQSDKLQLCYVLVWRNDTKSPTHFYAPFPGQVSEADFIKFYNDPYTLFEKDLKDIYKLKK